MGSLRWLRLLDAASKLALCQRDTHAISGADARRRSNDTRAGVVPAESVAAAEHGQRAERIELCGESSGTVHRGMPAMGHKRPYAMFGRHGARTQVGDHAADIPAFQPAAELLKSLRVPADACTKCVTKASIEVLPVALAQFNLGGPVIQTH